MAVLLHELIFETADCQPDQPALQYKSETLTYRELAERIKDVSFALMGMGIDRSERVVIYLPKCLENVIAIFGVLAAGATFVPVNPVLKPHQVCHILRDCNARLLITTPVKLKSLQETMVDCVDLTDLVLVDDQGETDPSGYNQHLMTWESFSDQCSPCATHPVVASDLAALIYTSGSTGEPKGVALSHHNMVVGAQSVAGYLRNTASDRILVVLPLSFDYGLSQLTTAFLVGATAVLINYLLPMEVLNTLVQERITGLATVPPLWNLLVQLSWPLGIAQQLRYITSSGGVMPVKTTERLRQVLPNTEIYLMYGLTEAFRSTYLPPDQVSRRPNSIGIAIPNAEILVLRPDGTPCDADEPGELVHRGPLVALGYWNDEAATRQRFRPFPPDIAGQSNRERAVWSGDIVKRDRQGYLYFIGRHDDLIKTSGFRVSPNEIEAIVHASGLVEEVVALGIPHATLGQSIALIVVPKKGESLTEEQLINACKRHFATYMMPARVEFRTRITTNANGKLDRKQLARELMESSTDV
ncbi:MAG: acyl-CoA ligase (AMP-forming), exosortase A system-associated [Candidatus Thiodiazotropha sp.]